MSAFRKVDEKSAAANVASSRFISQKAESFLDKIARQLLEREAKKKESSEKPLKGYTIEKIS